MPTSTLHDAVSRRAQEPPAATALRHEREHATHGRAGARWDALADESARLPPDRTPHHAPPPRTGRERITARGSRAPGIGPGRTSLSCAPLDSGLSPLGGWTVLAPGGTVAPMPANRVTDASPDAVTYAGFAAELPPHRGWLAAAARLDAHYGRTGTDGGVPHGVTDADGTTFSGLPPGGQQPCGTPVPADGSGAGLAGTGGRQVSTPWPGRT